MCGTLRFAENRFSLLYLPILFLSANVTSLVGLIKAGVILSINRTYRLIRAERAVDAVDHCSRATIIFKMFALTARNVLQNIWLEVLWTSFANCLQQIKFIFGTDRHARERIDLKGHNENFGLFNSRDSFH